MFIPLTFPSAWKRVPVPQHPCQPLLWSVFFILTIQISVQCRLRKVSFCAALSCLVLGSVSSSHVVLLDFQLHLFNSPWLLGSDWVPPSCAEAWKFSQGSKLGRLWSSLELEPRSFASLANILYFHTSFQVSCPLPDVQCSVNHYFIVCFLLISGGKANPIAVTCIWLEVETSLSLRVFNSLWSSTKVTLVSLSHRGINDSIA